MTVVQREHVARDGTRIGYQVRAARAPGAPTVVLANGLGATHLAFAGLLPALDAYRLIAWDYRGLFTSGRPRDPHASSVPHQIDDLAEILEVEGVRDFAVCGWSMGVQVALETVRRMPERVRGVFAMNGTPGRLLQSVKGVGFTLPYTLRLVQAQARLANASTRAVTGSSTIFALLKKLGVISGAVDNDHMRAVLAQFGQIDWGWYAGMVAHLNAHDADDVLARVAVPTTIVAGDRDLLTPRERSEYMHRRIPGARLAVIRGGTHYTPIEYPREVSAELARWLGEVRL